MQRWRQWWTSTPGLMLMTSGLLGLLWAVPLVAQQAQPVQPRCEDRLAVAQDMRGMQEIYAIQYLSQWRAEQQAHAATKQELNNLKKEQINSVKEQVSLKDGQE